MSRPRNFEAKGLKGWTISLGTMLLFSCSGGGSSDLTGASTGRDPNQNTPHDAASPRHADASQAGSSGAIAPSRDASDSARSSGGGGRGSQDEPTGGGGTGGGGTGGGESGNAEQDANPDAGSRDPLDAPSTADSEPVPMQDSGGGSGHDSAGEWVDSGLSDAEPRDSAGESLDSGPPDAACQWSPDDCGDGIRRPPHLMGSYVASGEECDDGNRRAGDGCSCSCTLEPGWTCLEQGKPCTPIVCGNGLWEASEEECDDGNTLSGDGCSATCVRETGWQCSISDSRSWCFPVRCGDGVSTEACDDGNTESGDGCSSTCDVEDGWSCVAQPPLATYGWKQLVATLPTLASVCHPTRCGDGIPDWPNEACDDGNTESGDGCSSACQNDSSPCGDGILAGQVCDDGNTQSGDGCSSDCQVEPDWSCEYGPCHPIRCGNGLREGNEDCDDGNTESGDGCASSCTCERGWWCYTKPYYRVQCGDGVVNGNEECDDGNTVRDDGCSRECEIEGTWTCDTPGEPCRRPLCGNSRLENDEDCDDGNSVPGDGCSESCKFEFGWVCPEAGPTCRPTCGNGHIEIWDRYGGSRRESCDDANRVGGDGCSASCQLEPGWICGPAGQPCRRAEVDTSPDGGDGGE